MAKDKDTKKNSPAKDPKAGRGVFSRLFGNRNATVDGMMEEQIRSPGRMMLNNFLHNPLGMAGLIVFLCIFLFVFLGPYILPIDLSDQDNTQKNVPPTYSMMNVPRELDGHVRAISAGKTFGVGCADDGSVYVWGYTKITETIDVGEIPEAVTKDKIADISAGHDHIVALSEAGKLYVWGNDRLGQANVPKDISSPKKLGGRKIVQIVAGFQCTGALTDDGYAYFWGNENMCDLELRPKYQGHIKKIAIASYYYCLLLDDGSVVYGGIKKNAFSEIPEALASGVVDISATGATMAGVKDDGTIIVWGNREHGEDQIPKTDSKPVDIYGGSFHYTALMENGDVISWGDNSHNQTTIPASVNDKPIKTVYAGFYQNYAVDEDGEVHTWGLKGHPLGTDDLGRDILTRIVNGGQTTMTVGAVSVVISIIIGVIMGGIAGYFGGKADMIIMRIAEVVGGLPFLPFALILSAIIPKSVSVTVRMYLIMVVLGVLSWTGICRLIRAQILAEREKEFVIAAQAMGVREKSIIFKHILPNVLSILLVEATLSFATCMLTESTLSYLGFGIPLPTPTWGNMLSNANQSIVIQQYWWRWVFPASIFGICTICINLIGDAIRDAVDPKSLGH